MEIDEYGISQLISDLHPDRIAAKLRNYNEARALIPELPGQTDTFQRFMYTMNTLHDHIREVTHGLGGMPGKFLEKMTVDLLEGSYANEGGVRGAFRQAKLGHLHEVCYRFIAHLRAEEERTLINSIIDIAIDPLNFKQQVRVAHECLSRLGPLMGDSGLRSARDLGIHYKDLLLSLYTAQKSIGPTVRE